MDGWQAVQNWAIFGVAVGGLAWYYYPKEKKRVEKALERVEKVKAKEQASAPKQAKPQHAKRSEKPEAKVADAPVTRSKADVGDDASADSTLNFAEQMMKARKGTTLKNTEKADARVKTVKQGTALRSSVPAASVEVSDDIPSSTATANAGGVADMLEPVAPGPTSLRIAPSQQPVKEKASKPAKKEAAVETKKQRQNRLKNEAKKQQREEEEGARKALEEKQRRSAREARGEPAKNGVPVSTPPANNAWSGSNGSAGTTATSHAPLLDTFDVESTSSSNAGASTAATSTSEAHQARWTADLPTEEEQIAAFAAQDDGWNEVKTSKKQKKKNTAEDSNGASTPVAAPAVRSQPTAPTPRPAAAAANGKPIGFQALSDELDQRADVDPDDVSSWVA